MRYPQQNNHDHDNSHARSAKYAVAALLSVHSSSASHLDPEHE
jgi:hypothetical protein